VLSVDTSPEPLRDSDFLSMAAEDLALSPSNQREKAPLGAMMTGNPPDILFCIRQGQQCPHLIPARPIIEHQLQPPKWGTLSLTFDGALRDLTILCGSSRAATVSSDAGNGGSLNSNRLTTRQPVNKELMSRCQTSSYRCELLRHLLFTPDSRISRAILWGLQSTTIGPSWTYSQLSAEPSVSLKRTFLYLSHFFFSPSHSSVCFLCYPFQFFMMVGFSTPIKRPPSAFP
jgi:hypothetical protein